jgi:excisionase family DNA binding protein
MGMTEESGQILVTVDQATRLMQIGRTKLLELAYDGSIPSLKVGARRLFKRKALEEWVDAQQEEEELYIALPR